MTPTTFEKFKYQTQVDSFNDKCDLTNFKCEENRDAWRWVFEDINDPRNFLPIAILTEPGERCTTWALSFYTTEDKAKKRLQHFSKKNPNIFKKVGTHAAFGKLNKTDGVSAKAANNGHYNHFEYEDIDLVNKFEVKVKIEP